MIARALLASLLLTSQALAQTVVLYSRTDAGWADKAHAMASVFTPVVRDRSLPPGAAWRPAMAAAICNSTLVLLVWSERAAASAEVRREIDTALICHVPVVPVLLDHTALPGLLADVNAVDWRGRE